MSKLNKALVALSGFLLIALIVMTTLFLLSLAKNAADISHVAMERQQTERLETQRDALIAERDALKTQLASAQSQIAAQTDEEDAAEPLPEPEIDDALVFDELAAAREQLASVQDQLEAAELLRDQAEHDTTMWRQQVERERRRAGTAEATQKDEDIAALSAELVEQAAANARLTATMAMALDRLETQNEQVAELVRYMSRLARRLGDTEAAADSTPDENEELEELYATIAQLHDNFARVAAENYDLGYRLENAEAERDAYERQLEQMLELPGPNLDKSRTR
ncbi:hypothetical protein OT109_07765 [Phycisphaeraceae bacterium D3-23]